MKKQTTKQAAESAAYRARHDEIGKILDNRGIRAALAEVSKGLERMTLRGEIVKFLHEIEFRISASLEFQDGTKEGSNSHFDAGRDIEEVRQIESGCVLAVCRWRRV